MHHIQNVAMPMKPTLHKFTSICTMVFTTISEAELLFVWVIKLSNTNTVSAEDIATAQPCETEDINSI